MTTDGNTEAEFKTRIRKACQQNATDIHAKSSHALDPRPKQEEGTTNRDVEKVRGARDEGSRVKLGPGRNAGSGQITMAFLSVSMHEEDVSKSGREGEKERERRREREKEREKENELMVAFIRLCKLHVQQEITICIFISFMRTREWVIVQIISFRS